MYKVEGDGPLRASPRFHRVGKLGGLALDLATNVHPKKLEVC